MRFNTNLSTTKTDALLYIIYAVMFYSRTNNEQFYPSLKNKHQPTRSLGWQQNLRTTTGTESNDIDSSGLKGRDRVFGIMQKNG